MSKKSKRTLDKSDTKRTVQCSFCGGEHRRRSRELDECRTRHRKGLPVAAEVEVARNEAAKGDEATRYRTDPLRGDTRAHSIMKRHRSGWPARKIAKSLDVKLDIVQDVIARAVR